MNEDRILLEGMIFYGRHGTLPAERELGQRFIVDIELRCDLRPAGLSDDLAKTVDYGEVHRQAREIAEGPPAGLTTLGVSLDHHPNKSAKANRGRPSCSLSQMQKLCNATLAAKRARNPRSS